MRFPGLGIGFVPWVFYLVMPHPLIGGALGYAIAIATVVAIAVTLWTRARSGAKLLEVSAAITFTVLTVAVLAGGEPVRDWLRAYSPAVALWVLVAVMAASVLTVPFTQWYARQALPHSYWHSPYLRSINRKISGVWTGCTLGAALSVSAAAITHGKGGAMAQYLALSLTLLLPLVLALTAYLYTEHAANTRAVQLST